MDESQLLTLGVSILGNTDPEVIRWRDTELNDNKLAEFYNEAPAASVLNVWRDDVTVQEILNATDFAADLLPGAVASTLAGLIELETKRAQIDVWRTRLQLATTGSSGGVPGAGGVGVIDFRNQNDFTLFTELFGPQTATRANLATLAVRNSTAAERLFIFETVGGAGRSSFLGAVSASDIRAALDLASAE